MLRLLNFRCIKESLFKSLFIINYNCVNKKVCMQVIRMNHDFIQDFYFSQKHRPLLILCKISRTQLFIVHLHSKEGKFSSIGIFFFWKTRNTNWTPLRLIKCLWKRIKWLMFQKKIIKWNFIWILIIFIINLSFKYKTELKIFVH